MEQRQESGGCDKSDAEARSGGGWTSVFPDLKLTNLFGFAIMRSNLNGPNWAWPVLRISIVGQASFVVTCNKLFYLKHD